MSRRTGLRRGRDWTSNTLRNPAYVFGASNAWRAADTTDNGSVTTTWVPYIGALTLVRTGTGQAIKAAVPQLAGSIGVAFNGVAAAGGYTGALAVGAERTIATVFRLTATNSGACAFTAAGVVNTGISQFHLGAAVRTRKITTDALSGPDVPNNYVLVSRYDAAGVVHYANSLTGVSAAQAGALVGDTFTLGCLDSAGFFTVTGAVVECMLFPRLLTAGEIAQTLRSLGRTNGVAIAT